MSRDDGNGGGDEPDTVRRSLGYAARALDSAGRKLLRTVERAVYEKVMTRVSPYYFDNELVSANLRRERNGDDEETFVFEVNINDDDLKERVGERLDEADEDDRERTTAQVRSSR